MNTASQNLPHHLQLLREKMLHPADYEFAVSYFLEEFAGDLGFLRQSQPDEARPLLAVVKEIAGRALGGPVAFEESKVFHLGGHGFYHGSAITPARAILFFYFQDADTSPRSSPRVAARRRSPDSGSRPDCPTLDRTDISAEPGN